MKRGLVQEGEDPLAVAANSRRMASPFSTPLAATTPTPPPPTWPPISRSAFDLTVVGLPKTVDNDVVPIKQTLGALTAAEQGAVFFENCINERSPAHAADP